MQKKKTLKKKYNLCVSSITYLECFVQMSVMKKNPVKYT